LAPVTATVTRNASPRDPRRPVIPRRRRSPAMLEVADGFGSCTTRRARRTRSRNPSHRSRFWGSASLAHPRAMWPPCCLPSNLCQWTHLANDHRPSTPPPVSVFARIEWRTRGTGVRLGQTAALSAWHRPCRAGCAWSYAGEPVALGSLPEQSGFGRTAGGGAGRPVGEVAADVRISLQTIYTWRCQDRIDCGLEPGLRWGEHAELVAASRPVTQRTGQPPGPEMTRGSQDATGPFQQGILGFATHRDVTPGSASLPPGDTWPIRPAGVDRHLPRSPGRPCPKARGDRNVEHANAIRGTTDSAWQRRQEIIGHGGSARPRVH